VAVLLEEACEIFRHPGGMVRRGEPDLIESQGAGSGGDLGLDVFRGLRGHPVMTKASFEQAFKNPARD
jgi:hypothetical protein